MATPISELESRMDTEYRSVFPDQAGAESEASTETRIPAEVYRRYDHYYQNSYDLYSKLGEFLKHELTKPGNLDPADNTTGGRSFLAMHPDSSVRNLRNPINRVVEFYATVILTGTAEEAFELEGARDALRDAIHRVWEWSNLTQTKQILKRYVGKYGQAFIKVASPTGSKAVRLQFIKPEYVAKIRTDETENLTYIRLEIPLETDPTGKVKRVRTEIYARGRAPEDGPTEPGYVRIYDRPADTSADTIPSEKKLKKMVERGQAKLVKDTRLRAKLSKAGRGSNSPDEKYTGFDFVPFVHVKARDTGESRPKPVYEHALPLVDQTNRRATRLDDMLFQYNKPHRAIVGIGNDAQNRPLAPPNIQMPQGQGPNRNEYAFGGSRGYGLGRNDDDITLGGDLLMGLPGNSRLEDVTPNVDFAAQRQAVVDDIVELHEELPELHYSATSDRAQLSGRALRTLLSSAIDRATEMRSNIEGALIKANKMALTVAQVNDLDGFSEREIGTYEGRKENGFDHRFKTHEVLPVSDDERAETRGKELMNAQQEVALGVKREVVMTRLGYDDQEVGEPEPEGQPDTQAIQRAQAQLQFRIGGGNVQANGAGSSRF